jgi:hypothetical protein
MQKGYIYEANGAWFVRFRLNGKQVSRKLADYNEQYRTKRSVRPLAGRTEARASPTESFLRRSS